MSLSKPQPHQSAKLRYPEQETVKSLSPIQERGPEKLRCRIRLYDMTGTPRRGGSYILKFMPIKSADMMTESLAHFSEYNHPQGFIDILNDTYGEEQRYSWDVELNNQLCIDVKMLDTVDNNCFIFFHTKKTLTREEIVPEQKTRLPSESASVEFTIQLKCEKTCEGRFRVIVKTDVEGSHPHTRDYNIMFTRKPQVKFQHLLRHFLPDGNQRRHTSDHPAHYFNLGLQYDD
ncbi:uncharacterized protein LOC116296241 [Actinia tenebrosa]|uniref:Uncharacterized protein LOC116296241 n=1 Tax=Actinia tenebrosa TaxID=6105 RepID=A0A6P8I5T5_ACTTE|nr:uncharacterized protein LOC116296241 [Actinia tenebrosa]